MSIAATTKFLVTRRIHGFDVPESPYFYGTDGNFEPATAWFLETLKNSERYLEFGSGGSTYFAAKHGIEFISVDSDRYFLNSVRKKIRQAGYERASGQTYHHADIGLTHHWGRPIVLGKPSAARLRKFALYSDPPPQSYKDGRMPDFVLVDGRFRVACALKTLRMLRETRGWTIAVDDYGDRPDYHAIADFAEIDHYVNGRMAVIKSAKNVNSERLDAAIHRYETLLD